MFAVTKLPSWCRAMALSEVARSVWAKSFSEVGAWLLLWQHMDDSADIAGGLFDRSHSSSFVEMLAAQFGANRGAARTAVMFLADLHDVAKATPAFAVHDDALAQSMREHGMDMPPTKDALVDRQQVYHSLAGHYLLFRWFIDRGWSKRLVATWAVALGDHHGVPSDSIALTDGAPWACPKLSGQGVWEEVLRELIDRMARRTGAAGGLR